MLGHSMGSFLLQDYVVDHGQDLAGAIFSATTSDLGAMRRVGIALLQLEALWQGRAHRSALAEAMSFKEFNKRFKPNRTASDWLSRDAVEVDKYVSDPLCGFRCSCGLWLDLLRAGANFGSLERLKMIPKRMPALLIAGSADPVCSGEAGPRSLEALYRQTGLEDVEVRMYEGARHELLNETCRDEVTGDLLRWLQARS
jgi:alpha-beta hydrolase superfamily lysophospholipase